MWAEGPGQKPDLSYILRNRRCSEWKWRLNICPREKCSCCTRLFFQEQILYFISVMLKAFTSLCFPPSKAKTPAVELNQRSSELHSTCINSFWCCFLLCPTSSAEPNILMFRTSHCCKAKIKYHLPNIFLISVSSKERIENAKEKTVDAS